MLGLFATLAVLISFLGLTFSIFKIHNSPKEQAKIVFDNELINDLLEDKNRGILGG